MNTRQTHSSLPAFTRGRSPSRGSEPAHFASRVNRGMKVDFERGIMIVAPTGDLGTLRYEEIHLEVGRINDVLRHSGCPHLLIDLSECLRIESVIMTAIVGFCRSASGTAAFCEVSDEIRHSMRSRGLLGLWPIYACRVEALRMMSGSDSHQPSGREGTADN